MIRKYLLPCAAIGLLLFAVLYVVHAQQSTPQPSPPIPPAKTPFRTTVAGAGIVEADTENIAIGSALPGVVLEVYVPVDKVGTWVKKGDPLFRVDDRQLNAQLAQARAQLAKLEAQPRPEELPPSAAKVAAAKANLALAEDQYQRAERLYPNGVSQEEYRQRRMAYEASRAQLAQAEAEYKLLKAGAWKPDIDIARAQVEQIATDLERTVVRAPVAGQVLQVNVRPGEYVGTPPNQGLIVLGGMDKVHVRVDIDEHDIPRFVEGAPAKAQVRGNPGRQYSLTFVRVEPYVVPKKSLTGDNTERVDTRVLQVIYAVDTGKGRLYVGQQMDVFIDTTKAPVQK
jgi:multidrug resistance efflux pump